MAKAVVEREARLVSEKRGVWKDEEQGMEEDEDGDGSDGAGGRRKTKRGTWVGGWFGSKRRE